MALIACIECDNSISDKALSCPHCGISASQQQSSVKIEHNNEVFKADKHNFVLSEITSLSQVSTRQWALTVVVIPLLILNLYAWQTFEDWMVPTVILVASFIFLGVFYTDDGKIYSTGSVREISDSMQEIREEYENRVDATNLVKYSQKTLLLNIEFTINPNRVASYSAFTTSNHWLFYFIGAVALGLAAYSGNEIFASGSIFLIFGYIARRGGIVIDGVGGSSEKIFTRIKDIKAIEQELGEKIANC